MHLSSWILLVALWSIIVAMSPLFAVGDVVWQALIAALLAVYIEWSRRAAIREARVAAELVAGKTEEVRVTLVETTAETGEKLDDVVSGQAEISEQVQGVHKATNSLADRLVEATRAGAHAAGVKEEKDRAAAAAEEENKS